MSKNGELEFVSVGQNDDDLLMNNRNQVEYDADTAVDSVIGSTFLKYSKHPLALCFHLLFKSLSIFFYIFGGWFVSGYSLVFITCIILLAMDFWTVKNVSGRLLVGLRWWSYVREDGSEEWIFESLEDMAEISALDSNIFWGAMYLTPIVWGFLLVVGFLRLKLEYLPIVLAAIFMNGANILGYIKCSNSAKAKMKSLMEKGGMAAFDNSSVRSWLMSSILSAAVPSSASRPAPRSATV